MVCRLLFVSSCWMLFLVCFFVVRCLLIVACCLSFGACYCCSLFVRGLMLDAWWSLFLARRLMFVVFFCLLYSMCCLLSGCCYLVMVVRCDGLLLVACGCCLLFGGSCLLRFVFGVVIWGLPLLFVLWLRFVVCCL